MHASETKTSGTAITGAALGGSALLVSLLNGGIGNLFGGMRPPAGDPPWARDMTYERELTKANAENGQLKAQIYCDQQINELRRELQGAVQAQQVFNATMNAAVATTAQQTQQLMKMTGLYINQDVMAASEAAMSAFKPAAASSGS